MSEKDRLFAEYKHRESERDISARILAYCVVQAETMPAKERWTYLRPTLADYKRDAAAYEAAFTAFRAACSEVAK